MHVSCGGDDQPASGAPDASADVPPDHTRVPYDGALPPGPPRVAVKAEMMSTRADTEQLLFAAGEMQTSGEPFASGFAGRNLSGYDRYYLPTDQYLVRPPGQPNFFESFTDIFGFSTAVESYEYSKYHMNMVLQQTGGGVSLVNGPLVARLSGATPEDKLRTRVEQLLTAAGTAIGGFATLPPPANNPMNDFGFPGVWPVFAPYKSFDPAITPDLSIASSCTKSTGYGGLQQFGNNAVPAYECNYTTLRLNDRASQIEFVTGPAILGFSTWKEALWAIDFTGRLHDSQSNLVNAIHPNDAALVGTTGNTVVGTDPPTAAPGTYIGSTPLEGMWGLLMVAEMDNAAEWLLSSLVTTDGQTLGGFASKSAATVYDYGSPLAWFPTAIGVTEDGTLPYPLVSSLAITDATSSAVDLAAILRGEALFFGMTDGRNVNVGQQLGLQLLFDGNAFARDDGIADGEETAHDRALALLRVAFVDLDRIHGDPGTGLIADTATINGGAITRTANVSTTSVAHVLLGLRTALMALNGAVTQYGAPNADPTLDAQGILNALPFNPPVTPAPTFSARVRQVFETNAALVRDVLTRADGTVAIGAVILGGVPHTVPSPATLDAQSAALRALVEGFLVTGDTTYRDRARAVARKLEAAFYVPAARLYRETADGPNEVHMTPERFAWLQSALREAYKSLSIDADPVLGRDVLEDRIGRVNKLFLNGWDDLNGDQTVSPATECLSARLQQAEQVLTGELGHDANGFPASGGRDRDTDCVPELAHAKIASTLASQVFFHSP